MYTEHVDLMATLSEAALGQQVPPCPKTTNASRETKLCTEGVSLLPLMINPNTPVKPAAFSQYPRGWKQDRITKSVTEYTFDQNFGSTCVDSRCTMGYSVAAVVDGRSYRYTAWVGFNDGIDGIPDFTKDVGNELYDHTDDPQENVNQASNTSYASVKAQLRKMVKTYARVIE